MYVSRLGLALIIFFATIGIVLLVSIIIYYIYQYAHERKLHNIRKDNDKLTHYLNVDKICSDTYKSRILLEHIYDEIQKGRRKK